MSKPRTQANTHACCNHTCQVFHKTVLEQLLQIQVVVAGIVTAKQSTPTFNSTRSVVTTTAADTPSIPRGDQSTTYHHRPPQQTRQASTHCEWKMGRLCQSRQTLVECLVGCFVVSQRTEVVDCAPTSRVQASACKCMRVSHPTAVRRRRRRKQQLQQNNKERQSVRRHLACCFGDNAIHP